MPYICTRPIAHAKQGESYLEGKPSSIEYQCDVPVMLGHSPQTEIDIYSNDDDEKAPVHLNSTTLYVGTLSLNLSKIPKSVKQKAKKRRMGWHRYYCLSGAIEARYGSANITYTLKLGGKQILHSHLTHLTHWCRGDA